LTDRHRIGVGIDREGREVLINLRQGGKAVSAGMSVSAVAAIAANLTVVCSTDDDAEMDFEVRGRLDVKEPA
jgi:hypothetical protein